MRDRADDTENGALAGLAARREVAHVLPERRTEQRISIPPAALAESFSDKKDADGGGTDQTEPVKPTLGADSFAAVTDTANSGNDDLTNDPLSQALSDADPGSPGPVLFRSSRTCW